VARLHIDSFYYNRLGALWQAKFRSIRSGDSFCAPASSVEALLLRLQMRSSCFIQSNFIINSNEILFFRNFYSRFGLTFEPIVLIMW